MENNAENNMNQPNNNETQPQEPKLTTPNSNRTLMAVLSYLGILIVIPFITSKEDSFVKFHLKQGLVVFCLEIIVWLFGSMFFGLWAISRILNLATIILSIIGIVNVLGNKEKELPLVGQFSKYFNF